MAGYIGSKIAVTQVDGYNRTEADAEFVQVTGDTMTGALTGTDLALSGGVYLGGTGAANYLDDYEAGTFEVSFSPSTSGTIVLQASENRMAYTKVGDLVTITGRIRVSSVSSPVGAFVNLTTLPFTSKTGVENEYVSGMCCAYSDDGSATFNALPIYIPEGVTYVQLFFPSVAAIDSDYRVHFSFSYIAA